MTPRPNAGLGTLFSGLNHKTECHEARPGSLAVSTPTRRRWLNGEARCATAIIGWPGELARQTVRLSGPDPTPD